MPKDRLKSDYDIVLKRTAKKLGLPEKIVYDVTYSLFNYVHKLVEAKEYEGFYFRYLGRFIVKPFRLKKALEAKERKELKEASKNV